MPVLREALQVHAEHLRAHPKVPPRSGLVFQPIVLSVRAARRQRATPEYAANSGNFICNRCNRRYLNKKSLTKHVTYICGKSQRFKCPYCHKRAKYRTNIYAHIRACHPKMDVMTMDLDLNIIRINNTLTKYRMNN